MDTMTLRDKAVAQAHTSFLPQEIDGQLSPGAFATSAGRRRLIGTILCDRFRIEEHLGTGAHGEIYRACDIKEERACTIKLVPTHGSFGTKAALQLMNEATIVPQLEHANITQVYGLHKATDGTLLLVREFLHGETLADLLHRVGRLPLGRVLSIIRPLAAALHHAHGRGYVHGDVSPHNVFLCSQRHKPVGGCATVEVKLMDFGLAQSIQTTRPIHGAQTLIHASVEAGGTPEYMSPESLQPGRYVDSRSDQWSLAVLTFEMLAGQLPFTQEDPLQLSLQIQFEEQRSLASFRQDLPQCVQSAISKALSKQAERRFPNVLAFAAALSNLDSPVLPAATAEPRTGKIRHPIPTFVAPEETREPTRLQGEQPTLVSKPSFTETEPAQALRTVEYSRAELIALLHNEAASNSAVPTVTTDSPTGRYGVETPIRNEPSRSKPHRFQPSGRTSEETKSGPIRQRKISAPQILSSDELQLVDLKEEQPSAKHALTITARSAGSMAPPPLPAFLPRPSVSISGGALTIPAASIVASTEPSARTLIRAASRPEPEAKLTGRYSLGNRQWQAAPPLSSLVQAATHVLQPAAPSSEQKRFQAEEPPIEDKAGRVSSQLPLLGSGPAAQLARASQSWKWIAVACCAATAICTATLFRLYMVLGAHHSQPVSGADQESRQRISNADNFPRQARKLSAQQPRQPLRGTEASARGLPNPSAALQSSSPESSPPASDPPSMSEGTN